MIQSAWIVWLLLLPEYPDEVMKQREAEYHDHQGERNVADGRQQHDERRNGHQRVLRRPHEPLRHCGLLS